MVDEVIDMIMVALRKIAKDHPFYGPVITQMRYAEDNETLDTGAMSANLEYSFNREYVKKLYEKYKPQGTGMTNTDKENVVSQELCGHILHELMHYIFDHHTRIKRSPRQDVNFLVHNIAADMEINQYIEYPHRTPQMPSNYKLKDGRPFPEYRTYEEYLELLVQSASSCKDCKNCPKDANGNPIPMPFDPSQYPQCKNCVPLGVPLGPDGMDISMKGYKDGKTTTAVQKLRGECESAAAQAQGKGSNPSDALKKVEKIVYNWEDVFKAVLHTKSSQMQYGFEHRTFRKPNRRLQGLIKNIIYPARVDYVTELNLVIGMDVSGSMSGLTEKMYGIMKSIADSDDLEIKVTILECDTAVCRVIQDFDVCQSEVLTTEGGGTDMGAISVYVQDHRMDPDLIVIMTDNYTDWSPVLFEDKTVVLTNNIMDTCPYKQFEVVFPAG